jgi:peptidoglycan lytic transglycosylase G
VIRRTALLALLAAAACGPPPSGPPVRIVVPAGARFSQVADSLVSHQVVRSRAAFILLARLRGVERGIQAGVYAFTPGTSQWEVLTILAEGRIQMVRFTVPEGLALMEIAPLAEERLQIARDAFLAAATDSTALAELGLPTATAEGFLLPETYLVPEGITARELVRVMIRQFQSQWSPEWRSQMDFLHLGMTQVVALASIVEGEARHDEERPIIAGVYLNRLRRRMLLQADPTVQYAILQKTGARKLRLYYKDYATPSKYNTYLHLGLPPGPINSPGRLSLHAALFPAQVPYLYFVAGSDGYHIFTKTSSEHQAAVAKVRKQQRAAARSPGR